MDSGLRQLGASLMRTCASENDRGGCLNDLASLQQARPARPFVFGAEHLDRQFGRISVGRNAVLVKILGGFLIRERPLSTTESDSSTTEPPAPVMISTFSPFGVGSTGMPRANSSNCLKLRARITPDCLNTSS